jgi:flagellin-like hook-associated protein FlgL
MTNNDKDEIELLAWVSDRIKKLDRIEAKLQEMKSLALLAMGRKLDSGEIQTIQRKINKLNEEVDGLRAEMEGVYH